MSDFYSEMSEMATELLTEFTQGSVQLKRVTTLPIGNPWDAPIEGAAEFYELAAVVKRVDQRYENGVLIVQTGDIVTFAVPAIVPQLSDTLLIDGTERAITSLRPIPPAGVVVAYKAWCAA